MRSSIPLYDERIRAIGEVVVVSSLFALSLACLFFLLALVNTHPGAEPRVPMAAVEIVLCGAMIATGVVGAVFWSTLRMRRVVDRCVRCGTLRDAQ